MGAAATKGKKGKKGRKGKKTGTDEGGDEGEGGEEGDARRARYSDQQGHNEETRETRETRETSKESKESHEYDGDIENDIDALPCIDVPISAADEGYLMNMVSDWTTRERLEAEVERKERVREERQLEVVRGGGRLGEAEEEVLFAELKEHREKEKKKAKEKAQEKGTEKGKKNKNKKKVGLDYMHSEVASVYTFQSETAAVRRMETRYVNRLF